MKNEPDVGVKKRANSKGSATALSTSFAALAANHAEPPRLETKSANMPAAKRQKRAHQGVKRFPGTSTTTEYSSRMVPCARASSASEML